ncbi:MAG: HAMP domain-containing histidine kinase [Lachnospiraceae bacterium]|nr:HAMP domain-containing histidine kinase [Lachnospiraceae bacterium]
MEKIKHLSIRKTIVLYMAVTLVLSYLVSYFVIKAASGIQLQIWTKYMGEQYFEEAERNGEGYESAGEEFVPHEQAPIVRPSEMEMSSTDWKISELCDFLQTYSILIFSMTGTVAAVFLFYQNKLKVPLEKLMSASISIGNNDLDFTLEYDRKDEMGRLCAEFEVMRKQLSENNRRMWQMVENEKALRASIAHDIRSPLAVFKGYHEMLTDLLGCRIENPTGDLIKGQIEVPINAPEEGQINGSASDQEKIWEREGKAVKTTAQVAEMLSEEGVQIKRMEDFLSTMKKLSSLEEREVVPKKVSLVALAVKYQKSMEILAKKSGKRAVLTMEGENRAVGIDEEMVTEVLENLFTNALRYAQEKVEVVLSVKEMELQIEVQDDGRGFREDKEILTKAFYHANPQDDLTHFGMGLYLCRIYCEKHGGCLLLGNRKEGGGKAVAVFGLACI